MHADVVANADDIDDVVADGGGKESDNSPAGNRLMVERTVKSEGMFEVHLGWASIV